MEKVPLGRCDICAGDKVDLGFVSAAPTGPIHLCGISWAAVGGSFLERVPGARCAQVTRGHYFNDHGDRSTGSIQLAVYMPGVGHTRCYGYHPR